MQKTNDVMKGKYLDKIRKEPVIAKVGNNDVKIYPLLHCGGSSTSKYRNLDEQIKDWEHIDITGIL